MSSSAPWRQSVCIVLLEQRLEARVVAETNSALFVEREHPDVGLVTNPGKVNRVVELRQTKGTNPIGVHLS